MVSPAAGRRGGTTSAARANASGLFACCCGFPASECERAPRGTTPRRRMPGARAGGAAAPQSEQGGAAAGERRSASVFKRAMRAFLSELCERFLASYASVS